MLDLDQIPEVFRHELYRMAIDLGHEDTQKFLALDAAVASVEFNIRLGNFDPEIRYYDCDQDPTPEEHAQFKALVDAVYKPPVRKIVADKNTYELYPDGSLYVGYDNFEEIWERAEDFISFMADEDDDVIGELDKRAIRDIYQLIGQIR